MGRRPKTAKNGEGVPVTIEPRTDKPYLDATFKMYALWKSLPPVLRNVTDKELEERFGIDTPMIVELLKVRNQGEFAVKFNVHPSTLSHWNDTLMMMSPLPQLKMWSGGMLRNVLTAAYENAINKKSQTGFIDRAWLFKLHGMEEKTTVRVEGIAEGLLEEIRKKRNPSAA